ncbi:MAG: hypothetical protein JWM53_3875 [bacterium]|nr:hypothetical protein [bacterium]
MSTGLTKENPLETIKHEHKKQLHDRVVERRGQLLQSLIGLKADPQNAESERARAVDGALAALETHLTGGWDSIDESESAALTRWLDSSRFLFDETLAHAATAVVAEQVQS